MRTDLVINGMVTDALLYKKLIIYGDGKQQRPFVHINFLIDKIESCIIGLLKPGVYNVAEANLSINQIKNVLIENIPKLEFTYVNTATKFKSLKQKMI